MHSYVNSIYLFWVAFSQSIPEYLNMNHYQSLGLVVEQLGRIAGGVNSPWAMVSAVGTVVVGVLAIFGEPLRKYFLSPCLSAVEVASTKQRIGQDDYRYQRLIVRNVGLSAAREVRILLTYTKAPENFIPVPLAWMHWQGPSRDVSRGEPAYVDVLQKREGADKYSFCWPAGLGSSDELLDKFDPGLGKIRLEFFERDRQIGDVTLQYSKENDKLDIVR